MATYRHIAAGTHIYIENDNPEPTPQDRMDLTSLVKKDKFAFRIWVGIKGQPIETQNIAAELEQIVTLVRPLVFTRFS